MGYPLPDLRSRVLLILALCLSPFVVTPSSAQMSAQTPAASSENSSLREIVSRLSGGQAQILVGQLPQPLPIDLPIPEQAQILGSVVGTYDQPDSYQIFLTVPRSPQQVESYYRQQLQAAGWTVPDSGTGRTRGFVSPLSIPDPIVFCQEANRMMLTLVTQSKGENLTAANLNLTRQDYSLCVRIATRFDPIEVPLPNLVSPPDARVSNIGGGGSNDSWVSSATIETSIDRQTLLNHYKEQLEQAGWRSEGSGNSEAANWSYLTLENSQGPRWQALLSIAPIGDANQTYSATVLASRITPQQ